jgi:hypothetical protein
VEMPSSDASVASIKLSSPSESIVIRRDFNFNLIRMVKAMSESRSASSSRASSSSFTSFYTPCRIMSNNASGFQSLSAANVRKYTT